MASISSVATSAIAGALAFFAAHLNLLCCHDRWRLVAVSSGSNHRTFARPSIRCCKKAIHNLGCTKLRLCICLQILRPKINKPFGLRSLSHKLYHVDNTSSNSSAKSNHHTPNTPSRLISVDLFRIKRGPTTCVQLRYYQGIASSRRRLEHGMTIIGRKYEALSFKISGCSIASVACLKASGMVCGFSFHSAIAW
jgi:hypothetical protein